MIIGAGPAGLTAAWQLAEQGMSSLVLERGDKVGGLARTESHRGYLFDIGGHRFYTQSPRVQALWEKMLGEDLIRVPRLSRIYYRGRFFLYPLEPVDAIKNIGALEGVRIVLSYLEAHVKPLPREDSFEEWVVNRFGRRLFETFFKTYTEKVWGIPCSEIRADWAAQRIRSLSLRTAIVDALVGTQNEVKSLVKEFVYPRRGPGMMWQRFAERVEERGGRVVLGTGVARIEHDGTRCRTVVTEGGERVQAEQVISSMPLPELIRCLDPPLAPEVQEAASALRFRALILVALIVKKPKLFPDNWIYVHSGAVRVGRIQNFNNWSEEMVPEPGKTCLGLEYFCNQGDDLWRRSDESLMALGKDELVQLGLASHRDFLDGKVIRQAKAYPVYDERYTSHLEVIRRGLRPLENLQTIGRNGMHRYNNQDHSMLTGLAAAENVAGAKHDLWEINTERSYYEDFPSRAGG